MDLQIPGIILAIMFLNPDVPEEQAERHADAVVQAAEDTGYEPELILAIAYVESNFIPSSLSYLYCPEGEDSCVRRGTFNRGRPAHAQAPWFCGVMQVGGNVSWDRCLYLRRNVEANYMMGARWLRRWERQWGSREEHCGEYDVGSAERITCALQGYNGGYPSINRDAQKYPTKVFQARDKIQEIVDQHYLQSIVKRS